MSNELARAEDARGSVGETPSAVLAAAQRIVEWYDAHPIDGDKTDDTYIVARALLPCQGRWRPSILPPAGFDGERLWLWRNGDGRFLAFRDLFPTMPGSDDPATLGQPCGYAIIHPMTLAEAQAVSAANWKAEGSPTSSPDGEAGGTTPSGGNNT